MESNRPHINLSANILSVATEHILRSSVLLAGGLKPFGVLYNITGVGRQASLSGNTSVNGILLAPERGISLAGTGFVIREVISGGTQITISGGGEVDNSPH